MTPTPDINACMVVLGQIKDPKVRYYWLKLGESLAAQGPKLVAAKPKPRTKRKN